MDVGRDLIICADDYAIAPGVSRAIVDLACRRRLSATSCMTVSPYWASHAAWLQPVADRLDVGLHLTLTDQRPIGEMPQLAPDGTLPGWGRFARDAYTGRLPRAEVQAQVVRQIQAFEDAFGAPPAFIDGHQHVHLLPVVREAVIEAARGIPNCWVRDCRAPTGTILRRGVFVAKALALSALSGRLSHLAACAGVPRNRGFAGARDFSDPAPFATRLDRFLGGQPGEGRLVPALLMCHPGFPDDELRAVDPVCEARRDEYDTLAGIVFEALLNKHSWHLAAPGWARRMRG